MKLEKAIEILIELKGYSRQINAPGDVSALQLGIEALKWRQLMENDYGSWCGSPLPGETED